MSNLYPNLYVIGTAKAGTTSLATALGTHADVFLPEVKEPHYWSEGFPPPRQSILRCVKDTSKYLSLYSLSSSSEKYRLDASTSYLCSPDAAVKISKLDHVKLIVVLRDPADRYISHYQNDYSDGVLSRRIVDVVTDDLDGTSNFTFYEYGLYAKHLRHWLSHFQPSAVLCVDFEELVGSSESTLCKICTFLGIENQRISALPRENSAYVPTSKFSAFLMKIKWLRVFARSLMPARLRKYLRGNVLFKSGKASMDGEAEARAMLSLAYKEEMRDLAVVLSQAQTVGDFSFIERYE